MSNDFYKWLKENITEDFDFYKHRTNAGDFLGWKYEIKLENTRRPKPIEVIEFTDGLYYLGINAWVKKETAQNILLALKRGLEKEQ